MPKINTKRTLEHYLMDFIEYCNLKDLSKKTMQSYYQSILLFIKYLEEDKYIISPSKVSKKDVEDYLMFTKERGKYSFVANEKSLLVTRMDKRLDIGDPISVGTINNYLRNIKVFFNWMEENNIIKKNTISKVKYLKETRKAKDQLTDMEVKVMLKAFDLTKFHEYRDYAIVSLILDSGMRLSETLNLTVNDIDFVRRTIIIPSEITKSRKERVVFYSHTVGRILNSWLRFKDTFQESELLFPTQRTNSVLSPSNFERNFRCVMKRTKIEKNITPHVLRNNFARRFLLAQGDIYTLSRLLGHSSVTVTEKMYLDLLKEDLRKQYSKFSPIENLSYRR
ncbi:tyrosine-type recombinase/integrase [Clostridium chrysemydis]|uniref:tyrosine-type recombinase/integrase n=1 Tax=Clostridium chrysemydis TaxID=2665504 RepID=UPI0018840A47|nr:tyrosine-type recombinase/integrase [Clostridium chrysemydis]